MLYDDISKSCVLGSYCLASASLLRYLMSHMLLYPVVHIAHNWMQDIRLG